MNNTVTCCIIDENPNLTVEDMSIIMKRIASLIKGSCNTMNQEKINTVIRLLELCDVEGVDQNNYKYFKINDDIKVYLVGFASTVYHIHINDICYYSFSPGNPYYLNNSDASSLNGGFSVDSPEFDELLDIFITLLNKKVLEIAEKKKKEFEEHKCKHDAAVKKLRESL